MTHQSLYQLFQDVTTKRSNQLAYRYKRDGVWHDVTWGEAGDTVRRASKSLIALKVGCGDRVNILSQTRLEWVVSDLAIVCAGAVTVGIYPTELPPGCAYIIRHCDGEVIFVENQEQVGKILIARREVPQIRKIIVYDGSSDPDNDVLSWQEFLELGQEITDDQLEERGQSRDWDDLASLVYTSGTTGVPKGAMITHGNLIFTSDSASQSLHLRDDFCTLLFLPLAHVFARLIAYCCMTGGVAVAFAESITQVAENLRETRPHFIVSVPRIFEKVYDRIITGAKEAGGVKEKLFLWAVGLGRQVSELQQQKRPVPLPLKIRHALANKLVLSKIQAAFGGRLIYAVSGAAPLNQSIAEFFHACGVLILEGIGMTENTSYSNVNRIDHNKFGTVGLPGPGIEVKIAEDGEILTRGKNTMKGYFKNPEATAETIDGDGWLHTGDVGEIDQDGFLRVTDRKKDLIITAGGKNVAPQRIERILRASSYLSQVVAIGDRRKFISVLVSLDPDNVSKWAQREGVNYQAFDDLALEPKLLEVIEREIETANRELASYESVKRFRVLPKDLSIEAGELTPTLKIKRRVVEEKYASLIEDMYRD